MHGIIHGFAEQTTEKVHHCCSTAGKHVRAVHGTVRSEYATAQACTEKQAAKIAS